MFLARLGAADSAAKSDYKDITPVKSSKDIPSSSSKPVNETNYNSDDDVKLSHTSASITTSKQSGIMEKVTEYLFDLFDANCMEDFHRIERFEMAAISKFEDESEEFTFEQNDLHREFVALFEELIENFLKTENVTIEEFYDEVKRYSQDVNSPGEEKCDHAAEVLQVIGFYTTFETWAMMMKEQAKFKKEYYKFFTQQLQSAIEVATNNIAPAKSKEHRFENDLK